MSKNLTGMKFGRLTALEPVRTEEKRGVIWKFRCECGGEKEVPARYLIRGQTASCGCIQQEHRQRKDIAGERFGRLTAVRPTDQRDPGDSVIWECECDCGNLIYYSVSRLGSGCVKSCGCLYDVSRTRCSSYRQDLVEETSLSSLVGAKQCHSNNRSVYTGVCWNAQTGMWMAYINFQKKTVLSGLLS